MLVRCFAAALALLMSTQAHAVCKQMDLEGRWKFNFDLNRVVTINNVQRVLQLSCILQFKSDGEIKPEGCDGVDSQGSVGEFFIAQSERKLVMKQKSCTARFSGQIVYVNDFGLKIAATTYFVNAAELSMSANKQMMLGWLGVNDGPWASVIAMKLEDKK